MTIYFSATITDDRKAKDRYQKVTKILKDAGHEVLQYDQDKLSPLELAGRTDKEIKEAYKMLQDNMKAADIYIADITYPSVGIGFEISQALSERKQTLVLFHKDSPFSPKANIEAQESEFITFQEYDSEKLEQILLEFLEAAKGKLDTRFTLTISGELDKYLTWSAEDQRVPKADVVREVLEEMMKDNKKYEKHLGKLLSN